MVNVADTEGDAIFTMRATVRRDELPAAAERLARRAGELLAGWPGGIPAGTPGFLMLPVPDGDQVEIEVGVPAEYEPSGVHPDLTAGFRPWGMVARFGDTDAAEEWLADNGYDSAGQPWMTLPDREVVWPVRPVRDTDTFVGRHGPRTDLGYLHESADDGDREVDMALGMVREGSTRRNLLTSLHDAALYAARFRHVVSPGDPRVRRYLTLAARAEIADKIRLTSASSRRSGHGSPRPRRPLAALPESPSTTSTSGFPAPCQRPPGSTDNRPTPPGRGTSTELTVDLDGPVVLVTGDGTGLDSKFVDAAMLAVALNDRVALELLAGFSLDEHIRACERPPRDFHVLAARAMLAVATHAPDATGHLEAVLRQAETTATHHDVGPWYAHMEVPVWRLALGRGDAREALIAHRTWWNTCQPNPGDRQDRSPRGFVSLGVLCFGDGTVRSEYLPEL